MTAQSNALGIMSKSIQALKGRFNPAGVSMPHIEPNINKQTCLTCHFFNISRRVRTLNATPRVIEFDEISVTCTLLKKRFEHSRNSETTPPYGCAYKRWHDLP